MRATGADTKHFESETPRTNTKKNVFWVQNRYFEKTSFDFAFEIMNMA